MDSPPTGLRAGQNSAQLIIAQPQRGPAQTSHDWGQTTPPHARIDYVNTRPRGAAGRRICARPESTLHPENRSSAAPKEGILSSPVVAAVSPPGAQKCTIDEYTSFQMAIRLKAPVSPAALAAYLQLP